MQSLFPSTVKCAGYNRINSPISGFNPRDATLQQFDW
jgi:hypothetical protein